MASKLLLKGRIKALRLTPIMKTLHPARLTTSQPPCLFLSLLLLSATLLVQAQPNPDNPVRPRPPIEDRQRGTRPEPRMQPVAGLPLMERVLTEEQRQSIREIMASQRETVRALQEKIRAARQDLLKASLAEPFDEATVRAKAQVVANLETDLTVVRAKALSQVQPPLSDRQIERMMNPPPADRMAPANGGPRPGDRPGERPPRDGRDGGGLPRPPKPNPL